MGAAPAPDVLPDEPPGDPSEAPLARPPGGQAPPTATRWEPDYTSGLSSRRKVQLSLAPAYSFVALDFIGRPQRSFHGGGILADLDIQIWKHLWLRLGGTVTAHPLRHRSERNDDDEVVDQARKGTLTLAGANAGLAYGLDVGRILTTLDAAFGAFYMGQPDGIQKGQLGSECRDGACDPGLACGTDNVCRTALVPTLSAGLTTEWLVRNHWTVGASIRYYALLAQPSVYPVYLLLSARVGVRF